MLLVIWKYIKFRALDVQMFAKCEIQNNLFSVKV